MPAVEYVLADARAKIAALLKQTPPYSWSNLIQPLEDIREGVDRTWSPVSHLHAVADNPEVRDAYNACLPKLTEFFTELGQNEALFNAYRAIAESQQFKDLEPAQKKITEDALRDFRLSGVSLCEEKRTRFKAIAKKLAELSSRFGENVLDATQAWKKVVANEDRLAGLPDTAMELARSTARREDVDGWLLTLEFPSYFAVITYADDRNLRREIYEAYTTRASEQGPHGGQWDNTAIMAESIALRHELAELLEFANYAEYSLATKMASSTNQVLDFLSDLARRSRPIAESDMAELQTFACEHHRIEHLEAWDIAYFSEKLREQKYAISQEELRPYFPAPRVLHGLFEIVRRLYGLEIRRVDHVECWHNDVQFFEIFDADGDLRGQFYLDLYARPHKRGGAWMDECRVRKRVGLSVQTPVAYLTCNFSPPLDGRPSLLTHDEVATLFHEFGHGLHHLLTQIDYPSAAGIRGVPWDAVELPSQFMENWCWEREALDLIAQHHDTGEPLPEALYDRMKAARDFQAGMQMVRQLEFALLDFRLHVEYDPLRGAEIQALLDDVREQVAVIIPPPFNRFAHSFSHIFAGGYAAGYYSYKWAEVLSSDAFSKFEEEGIFDRDTGSAFLHTILEQGGSREPMDLFVLFRGREPSIDALLRHTGIASENPA